jgi:hypothetical protein
MNLILNYQRKFKHFQIWPNNPWTYTTYYGCSICLQDTPKGKKPLVYCSQSHVVTFNEYLNILPKKIMDKTIVKEIKDT